MTANNKKFITLCTTAIGLIYAAGYVATQPPAPAWAMASAQPNGAVAEGSTPAPDNSLRIQPSPLPSASMAPSREHRRESDRLQRSADRSVPAPGTGQNRAPGSSDLTSPNTPAPTATPSAKSGSTTSKTTYKDGTFTGSGTNRFGTVEVAVTIAKGKIDRVEITRSATRYPQRYIDSLPAEVVASQSADIDAVSGATRSSEDFINAVRMALAQAV